MKKILDKNIPVLVGLGVAQQCYDDPLSAGQPYQLMAEAVEAAAVDAGSERLLAEADIIYVPRGMWEYSDPARLIANEIAAENARTVLAEIGVLQQSLIAEACQKIQSGELDIAIVAGGEAKYRQLRAAITNTDLSEDLKQQDVQPDVTLTPAAELWSSIEADAGLGMPVGYYAIMESALRNAAGLSIDHHRDQLAALYESFSRIAVDNPNAWNRKLVTAESIRKPIAGNKMLAFPYTKYHSTQWNVDQAAGLIFCSQKKAQALGIAPEKWIYPVVSTESNHMVNTAQRQQLHRSSGARLAGAKALELAGLDINEIKHLDLYSCFPAAVQIFAQELAVDLDRPLTVTGGMAFAGGPLNNYVLQSSCRVIELLREDKSQQRKANAMVTSISGMNTKQSFGLWSTEPPRAGFQFADVTEQVKAETVILDLVEAEPGPAVIVAYTVLFNAEQASRGVAVCNLADGRRSVVYSESAADLASLMSEEGCGRAIEITADSRFRLT